MKDKKNKAIMAIAIDPELAKKVKEAAERAGTSVSETVCVAIMAMYDRKALLMHTGGLFKRLFALYVDEIDKKVNNQVGVEIEKIKS